MSSQNPIKVGIVGYGSSARVFHLPYILTNPDLDIVAFLQRDKAPVPGKPHCTVDFPDCTHYTEIEAFLQDKDIELVVILTQHDTHAEYSEKALLAGKHGKSVFHFMLPVIYSGSRLICHSRRGEAFLEIHRRSRSSLGCAEEERKGTGPVPKSVVRDRNGFLLTTYAIVFVNVPYTDSTLHVL
jgi:hypothetical protein